MQLYCKQQHLNILKIPNKILRLDHYLFAVLHDIIATMFHKRFMDELFKPQPLYSKKAMRTVFDRLAHASIMRLNAASMDKVGSFLPLFLFCL